MLVSLRPLRLLTVIWVIGLVISGFAPYDRLTWLMEVAPALIALPLLLATRTKFEFTALAYGLITLHGLILMLGGAYTYARVPLGFLIQDWWHLGRNPYDKIGHFAQGFVPAIVGRELLIRLFSIQSRKLVAFLAICICLAVSALYELIEWWSALLLGQGADEFLGTQGDPWDTQSDMFFALIGAVGAIVLLSRRHDKAMLKLNSGQSTATSA
jgi:putative membrane protein